jgi:hypothetical protein
MQSYVDSKKLLIFTLCKESKSIIVKTGEKNSFKTNSKKVSREFSLLGIPLKSILYEHLSGYGLSLLFIDAEVTGCEIL